MDENGHISRIGEILIKFERIYDSYAKSVGLAGTELLFLHIVHSTESCTQKEICERMFIPKQTVSSIVRSFLRDGMVELVILSRDRRSKAVRLTERGREYADRILPRLNEADSLAMSRFSAEETRSMFELLDRYVSGFSERL